MQLERRRGSTPSAASWKLRVYREGLAVGFERVHRVAVSSRGRSRPLVHHLALPGVYWRAVEKAMSAWLKRPRRRYISPM